MREPEDPEARNQLLALDAQQLVRSWTAAGTRRKCTLMGRTFWYWALPRTAAPLLVAMRTPGITFVDDRTRSTTRLVVADFDPTLTAQEQRWFASCIAAHEVGESCTNDHAMACAYEWQMAEALGCLDWYLPYLERSGLSGHRDLVYHRIHAALQEAARQRGLALPQAVHFLPQAHDRLTTVVLRAPPATDAIRAGLLCPDTIASGAEATALRAWVEYEVLAQVSVPSLRQAMTAAIHAQRSARERDASPSAAALDGLRAYQARVIRLAEALDGIVPTVQPQVVNAFRDELRAAHDHQQQQLRRLWRGGECPRITDMLLWADRERECLWHLGGDTLDTEKREVIRADLWAMLASAADAEEALREIVALAQTAPLALLPRVPEGHRTRWYGAWRRAHAPDLSHDIPSPPSATAFHLWAVHGTVPLAEVLCGIAAPYRMAVQRERAEMLRASGTDRATRKTNLGVFYRYHQHHLEGLPRHAQALQESLAQLDAVMTWLRKMALPHPWLETPLPTASEMMTTYLAGESARVGRAGRPPTYRAAPEVDLDHAAPEIPPLAQSPVLGAIARASRDTGFDVLWHRRLLWAAQQWALWTHLQRAPALETPWGLRWIAPRIAAALRTRYLVRMTRERMPVKRQAKLARQTAPDRALRYDPEVAPHAEAIVQMLLLEARLNAAGEGFSTLSEDERTFWESAGPLQSLLEAHGPR